MNKIFLDKSTPFNNNLGCYSFNNVVSFQYTHCHPSLTLFTNDSKKIPTNNYLIIGCSHIEAYPHCIYEYFIFIKTIKEIIKKVPDIKLVLTSSKKVIPNMFKFFGFTQQYATEFNPDNTCYFLPLQALNDKEIDKTFFSKKINEFLEEVNHKIPETIPIKHSITIFPRQLHDNFGQRVQNGMENVIQKIKERNGTVVNTYDLNDIHKQIEYIRSSEILIFEYGGSFKTNGIYCKGKKIIVMCNSPQELDLIYMDFVSYNYIYEFIRKNNDVVFIVPFVEGSFEITYEQIEPYLKEGPQEYLQNMYDILSKYPGALDTKNKYYNSYKYVLEGVKKEMKNGFMTIYEIT